MQEKKKVLCLWLSLFVKQDRGFECWRWYCFLGFYVYVYVVLCWNWLWCGISQVIEAVGRVWENGGWKKIVGVKLGIGVERECEWRDKVVFCFVKGILVFEESEWW